MSKRDKLWVVYPGGLSVQWSNVNSAWLVMWFDQVLRVITDRDEAITYANSLVPEEVKHSVT